MHAPRPRRSVARVRGLVLDPSHIGSLTTGSLASTSLSASSGAGGGTPCTSFCKGSTATFCDDFDGTNPLAKWMLNSSSIPPGHIKTGLVASPTKSCPSALEIGLLHNQPSPTFLTFGHTFPNGNGDFTVSVSAYETLSSNDTASVMVASYEHNGATCAFLVQGFPDYLGVLTQKLTASNVFDLDNTGSPTSSSPANRWVSYRLHVTPLGASTKVELEADGQAPQTAMVTDADCGGGPDPGTLHLNLGVHYEATTHTTYSDDVEVSY